MNELALLDLRELVFLDLRSRERQTERKEAAGRSCQSSSSKIMMEGTCDVIYIKTSKKEFLLLLMIDMRDKMKEMTIQKIMHRRIAS